MDSLLYGVGPANRLYWTVPSHTISWIHEALIGKTIRSPEERGRLPEVLGERRKPPNQSRRAETAIDRYRMLFKVFQQIVKENKKSCTVRDSRRL